MTTTDQITGTIPAPEFPHAGVRSNETALAGESSDPCPAPLAWQEVLDAYRAEAEPWEVRCGKTLIQGRTWGDGPPLYLVPPLGGTHELYSLLVWLLREDFRCIAWDDFRTARGDRLEAGRLTQHLFAAADRHGDDRFRLFAPAFGSVTALSAMSAMSAQPDRVLSAALLGGFAHRRLSRSERLLIQLGRRLPCKLASVPFHRLLQTQNHLPWFPPIDRGRWSFFVENTGQIPVTSLAQRAAVLREFDVRDRLHELAQPVLLVRTEGEGLIAAACQGLLAERLPNARVESLHSSGQLTYLTHPHRLAKLLRIFFLPESGET